MFVPPYLREQVKLLLAMDGRDYGLQLKHTPAEVLIATDLFGQPKSETASSDIGTPTSKVPDHPGADSPKGTTSRMRF
jgi:hypothetical protein